MSVVDIIILIFLGFGILLGFKSGVIKRTTSFIGIIAVIILAFILKNKLSVVMYEHLPFFNLFGMIKGLDAINILIYEVMAFLIISSILLVLLKLLIKITGILEGVLKATVILSIPSKILGMVVGFIEMYLYLFIILVILNLPIFNISYVRESKVANFMLNNTIGLSSVSEEILDVYDNVYEIIEEKDEKSNEEMNEEILKLLLDKEIITKESASKLIEEGKIHVNNKNIIN